MKSFYKILIITLFLSHTIQAQEVAFDSLQSVFKRVFRQDLDSARTIGNRMLELSKKSNDSSQQATAFKLIGNTYAVQANFEQAQYYFYKSYDLLKVLDDPKGVTIILNNIGTVFYELGNYTQAQDHLLESLKIAEELQDDNAASLALNNLGNVHNDLRNNEKALDYYQRSLDIKIKLGYKNRLPSAYNNIGLVYSNLGEPKKAIESLTKSAEIAKEIGDRRSVARAFSNLGIQYSMLKEYATALAYFNKSISIQSAMNDNDGLSASHLQRGLNYLQMKRYTSARTDCLKSLNMGQKSGALNLQKDASLCASQSLEGLGQSKLALAYHKRFQLLKDSLFNKEKTQEITRTEMNYQFEKQQLADSIAFHKLQTKQQVTYERSLNSQHQKFYITLIVGLVIILVLVFLYWKHYQNLKLKKLENQLLNSEIEFKKKDLTNLAINISSNQEWAESLGHRLDSLKASTGRKRAKELEELESEIKNKIWVNKDSDEFYKKIDSLSSSFYNRLTSTYEGLTKTEIRMCSLIKLNLNTKQIATLQNINPASVKMSRNRLRKKLRLSPEEDLNAFLRSF